MTIVLQVGDVKAFFGHMGAVELRETLTMKHTETLP